MGNKAALVFCGQGSQFPGMGMKLYGSSTMVRAVFELSSSVFGYNVAKMCFQGPQEKLNETIYCQACTLTLELAIYEMFKDMNIPFHSAAGFSLGEYAALMATGVIDMRTSLELVHSRSKVMEMEVDNNAGRMAAIIDLNVEQIESLCERLGKSNVAIANYNSYEQIVVSHSVDCYKDLSNIVRSFGGCIIPLKVNRPFHHLIMQPAANKYVLELRKYKLQIPNKDIYLNVTGEKHDIDDSLIDKLYKQIFSPVQWIRTIENMLADGIYTFYEISPKPTLASFINNISDGKAIVINVQNDLLSELVTN